VGGALFFTEFCPQDGYQLWMSNSNGQGAVLVKDITPAIAPIPVA
jgi:ELWxxDGT repeat protein